jgi:23S rRNA (adenine2503-C2)-methyltransferase
MADCVHYFNVTGRRVSFEYILIDQLNDQLKHAKELGQLLRSHHAMRSHVNLIPWNTIEESDFKAPSRNRVMEFMRALKREGVHSVSIRRQRGSESAAACGQLRNSMNIKAPKKQEEEEGQKEMPAMASN